jgi:hypothetical protein
METSNCSCKQISTSQQRKCFACYRRCSSDLQPLNEISFDAKAMPKLNELERYCSTSKGEYLVDQRRLLTAPLYMPNQVISKLRYDKAGSENEYDSVPFLDNHEFDSGKLSFFVFLL